MAIDTLQNEVPAEELANTDFVTPPDIVKGVIPAGLGFLVAGPKVGKSWLALDLCCCVANGAPWLGFETNKADVLYIDLEESPAFFKANRLMPYLGGAPAPAHLWVLHEAKTMDEGFLDDLEQLLQEKPGIKLIVVDNYAKIAAAGKPFSTAYQADYQSLAPLKAFAEQHGVCVLLLHHTAKRQASNFDRVNGSTALFGVSDFTIIMEREDFTANNAAFKLTGRSVKSQEYSLLWDETQLRWRNNGTADDAERFRLMFAYKDSAIVQTVRKLCETTGDWRGNYKQIKEAAMQEFESIEFPPSGQQFGKELDRFKELLAKNDLITYRTTRHGGAAEYNFHQDRIDNTSPEQDSEQTELKA